MNLGIRKSYEGLPPNIEVWDQLLYFSLISLVLLRSFICFVFGGFNHVCFLFFCFIPINL